MTKAMARYASPKEKKRERKGRGWVHLQLQKDEEGACLLAASATGYRTQHLLLLCSTENLLVSFPLSLLFLSLLASTRTLSFLSTSLNRHLPQGWFSFLKTSTPLLFLIRSFQLIPCLSLAPWSVAVVPDPILRSYLLAVRGFASYHPALPVSLSANSVIRSSQSQRLH